MKYIYLLFTITLLFFGTPLSVHATTNIPLEMDDIFWANDSTGDQQFGSALAKGDINNDGFEDIVIGSDRYDKGSSASDENVGRVSIIYGSSSQWNDSTITSAVTITGENQEDFLGGAVAVGDVDNDGYDDIFMGATGYGANGAVYLVYGQSAPLSSISVTDSSVRKFTGESGVGYVGNSLSIGDVNGDGRDDITVGAQFQSNTSLFVGPGSLYIKYGLNGSRFGSGSFTSRDVKINGVTDYDYTGTSVSASGDLDHDGYDDIVIGACQCGGGNGKTYVIYGSSSLSSTINLSSAITLTGEQNFDKAGSSVSIVGDINNDTYDDLVIGAPGDDSAFTDGGSIYIIYGSSTRLTSRSLSDASIVQISGGREYGNTGSAITGGNINNDSYDDILIGTPQQYDPAGGRVNIIYGKSTAMTADSLNSVSDIQIDSLVSGYSNYTGNAIIVGDWNGDNFPDLSIASYLQKVTLANVGAVHTYYQRIDADQDGYAASTDHVLFDGTDCDDTDISIYAQNTYYEDQDSDDSGTGNVQTLCQGASPSAPAGYRTSVADITDCNDTDSAVSANQTYYQDADGDTIGSGNTETICSATPSAGYRRSVIRSNDCNDADSAVSANQTYYQDADNDTIGSGITETICSATPSSGYRVSVSGTNDCNDSDSAVTTNRTYYSDTDHDGLGSNDALLSCTATAPENYVSNSNDTNDSIANNGIEISGDGIDNDSDGVIDEVNTLASNGAHPAYKNLSITSSDDYKAAIQSVNPLTRGSVRVVFKDGSVYDYTIFTTTTSKKTLYTTIKNTGRIVTVSDNGKQIRTINLFTGAIIDTKTGIKSKTKFTVHTLLLQDIRNDGSLELLVTSSDKKKHTYVTLTRIAQSSSIAVKARAEIKGLAIDTRKTKIHSTTLQLRNSARKVLKSFTITKLYDLKNLQ